MRLHHDKVGSGGGSGKSQLSFHSYASIGAGNTRYVTNIAYTSEKTARIPVSFAGTLKNLYVESDGAPGAGETFTYTIMINGVASSITCTISGAVDDTANDTVNTESVSAGDKYSLRVVVSGAGATVAHKGGAENTPS